MKKFQKRQPSKFGSENPLLAVNVDFAASGAEINIDKMRSLICNPIYVGFGPFPQLVDDETWITVASRMIKKEGAEQSLVNMLYTIWQAWSNIENKSGIDEK